MKGAPEFRARRVLAAALIGLAVAGVAGVSYAAGDPTDAWTSALRRADEALGRKEFSTALKAANDAYGAALSAQRWEGLVAVGDAYRRLGEATGLRQSFDAKAREVYLKALSRSRQQASVEGVLRTAEGFVALGDTATVVQCVQVAGRLAGRDPDAQADVRAFAARFSEAGFTTRPRQP